MKLTPEIKAIIEDAESFIIEANTVKITRQLDRRTYEAVNKVLEALGGKWNRRAKAHLFEVDPSDAIDQALATGEVQHLRDDLDFYETPVEVVDRMIDAADLQSSDRVLEPSAGRGAIVNPLFGNVRRIDCIEKDPRNVEFLKERFGHFQVFGGVLQRDFLTVPPLMIESNPPGFGGALYDKILMNPPFSKRNDIHHVLHALKSLKTTGTLVAVMSAGVMFRNDNLTKAFWMTCGQNHRAITKKMLPEGSFRSSGTMVNTCLVTVGAWR